MASWRQLPLPLPILLLLLLLLLSNLSKLGKGDTKGTKPVQGTSLIS